MEPTRTHIVLLNREYANIMRLEWILRELCPLQKSEKKIILRLNHDDRIFMTTSGTLLKLMENYGVCI